MPRMRVFISVVSAFAIVSGLVLTMSYMISRNSGQITAQDENSAMNFIRVKRAEHLDVKKRQKPEKPKKPKTPPKLPKMNIAQNTPPQAAPTKFDMPNLDIPLALGNGPSLGGYAAQNSKNSQVVPLVRIEPQYPRKAAMAGKEGWVQLSFDINESGMVENVSVIKSNPRRLFDKAAMRSLLKWKYQPKVVDGKAVKQKDNKVQIDFKLRG